jgi:hypothetical protein
MVVSIKTFTYNNRWFLQFNFLIPLVVEVSDGVCPLLVSG